MKSVYGKQKNKMLTFSKKIINSCLQGVSMLNMWKPKLSKWIWLAGEEKPANSYVQFRKTFELSSTSNQAKIFVCADCKYLLFINGQVVGRGPLVVNPKHKQVDFYDVANFLKKGKNVIAAIVLQRHNKTSRLWPVRGGFLFELETDSCIVASNDSCKARWAIEYKSCTPYMTHQYGNQEWFDARIEPENWRESVFDDSDWDNAVIIKNSESFWPQKLELRSLAHMLRQTIHPVRLVSYFGIWCDGNTPVKDREPARQIEVDYILNSAVVYNTENLINPGNTPTIFQENSSGGDGVGFVIDIGEEMIGYPFIDIECPAGVTVEIGHGKVLSRNRIKTVLYPESAAEQRYADRYITRKGRQRFEIFDTKGCRYLEVHFRHVPKAANGTVQVKIYEIGLIKSVSPITHKAEFSCSDSILNKVFDICRRTAEVKCQDWHICDAQREQNQWIELMQDIVYLNTFGKVPLIRQTIQNFVNDQLTSGLIPSTLPPIDENQMTDQGQYIFSSYMFPILVYIDWLYGGQDERQPNWIKACTRVFDCLLGYLGSENTIENTPGDHWVEWTALDSRPNPCSRKVKEKWEVSFYNFLIIIALEKMAEMADAFNKTDIAHGWRDKAKGLRKASDARFFSEQRQAYVDGIYDGQPSDTVSQSTNAAAILARVGSTDRLLKVAETIVNKNLYDVDSAINTMALYHEALESLNQDNEVPNRIRKIWGEMLNLGATTTWESKEALERFHGMCFGFGAHPLCYIVRNYLGIVPLKPGFELFSIKITPHNLSFAKGKAVTPQGYIDIIWHREADILKIELTIPDGCRAILGIPRIEGWNADNVSVVIDDQQKKLSGFEVALCTFLREKAGGVEVESGKHSIIIEKR
jgi:hypothetical protein